MEQRDWVFLIGYLCGTVVSFFIRLLVDLNRKG